MQRAKDLPAPSRTRRVSAPRQVLAVAVLGTFMAFVDATIVNIAVPSIGREFSGSPLSSVSWVLNAYNIVFAAFLVGGGQLADLLGRRRVFSFALVIFTGASALCAAAPTLGLLVLARTAQAAGAAMLVPSSLAMVLDAHDADERMHAVALWAAVAALAAGIGPPLGGLLISASSWRLVFLVNVPVGIAALVLAQRVLVESRAPGRRRMPDLLGGLLLALAIGALVLALVKGQEWGWGSARVLGAFAASLALGGWFVARSSRHPNPLVDLSLLRNRTFTLSNGVTIVMAAGFYAYTLCNVLFLTGVWRYSVLQAGLALTPGPLTAIAVAPSASRLVQRVGHRVVAVPGALIWAAGMAFFATNLGVSPDFLGEWLPGMIVLGVGAGLTFPTLSGAAVGSVPGAGFAMSSALNSVARQLGAALGVAMLIAIIGVPSPAEALHAFERGWVFAGACFLVGAVSCLGLVVKNQGAAQADAEGLDLALDWEPVREEPAASELPRLAEAAGEHADVEPQTRADFLRRIEVFSSLQAHVLEEVAALAQDTSLRRGEWLFREGDDADALYAVRLGHLEVVRESGEEVPHALNTLTRGAVLGELALLSDSVRSASVRALRDSELLRIDRASFESLLRSEPELAIGLARSLSDQLQASRAIPPTRRARPVTVALVAADPDARLMDVADELSRALCAWGRVAVLFDGEDAGRLAAENGASSADAGESSRAAALARYAPLVERCEQDHDQVLMVCRGGPGSAAWQEFCIARADRVIAVVGGPAPAERSEHAARLEALRGADLLAHGVRPGAGELASWMRLLSPVGVFVVSDGPDFASDVARAARRLAKHSVGLVLSGGGARAFAHLGVLDVLLGAGLNVDRVAGVSLGSFVGGMLACGYDSAAIDAACYEEFVRRNPINDYTLPRRGLIRGRKAEAMLERVFGDVRVEELARPYYCACVNLRDNRLLIEREGSLVQAVGASMSLPLIAPPISRDGGLLVDGSLLDNLPIEPMSASGEGPILAVDVKAGREHRADAGAHEDRRRAERVPLLPETMARIALLSSANTDESARSHADLTIPVRVDGVGLLEFHQIDVARAAGRSAALAALEDPPAWLLRGAGAQPGPSGRRTVIHV